MSHWHIHCVLGNKESGVSVKITRQVQKGETVNPLKWTFAPHSLGQCAQIGKLCWTQDLYIHQPATKEYHILFVAVLIHWLYWQQRCCIFNSFNVMSLVKKKLTPPSISVTHMPRHNDAMVSLFSQHWWPLTQTAYLFVAWASSDIKWHKVT